MGLVKGSIKIATSEEQLAYSEDSGVTAGAKRDGCGWVPVSELERVGDDADVVTVASINADHRTQYRNIEQRIGTPSANVHLVIQAVTEVKTKDGGKVRRLTGDELVDWVKALARTNPKPIDHLAERILVVAEAGDLEADYAANRRFFGKRQPAGEVRDDAASKRAD